MVTFVSQKIWLALSEKAACGCYESAAILARLQGSKPAEVQKTRIWKGTLAK